MPKPFHIRGVAAVWLVLLSACGGRVELRPGPALAPECAVLDLEAAPPDTVTLALLDEIEPAHAPQAHNASERLLFRNLYEPLIHSDCSGNIYGGLAASWTRSDGGRRWSFVLREDVYFWDGDRISAEDVAASWRASVSAELATAAGLDSTIVEGQRTIHLFFDRPLADVPRFLVSPEFTIVKRSASSPWPIGSGPYRIEEVTGPGTAIDAIPTMGSRRPILRFSSARGADARDLLAQRIDMMVTADPAAIEYAATRSELAVVPLPWDRTYLLLSTTRVQALRRGESVGTLSTELLEAMARDAVRESARGSRPPGWWADLDECHELASARAGLPPVPRGAFAGGGPRRIIYPEDDRVARGLADRIVALAVSHPSASSDVQSLASSIPELASDRRGVVARSLPRHELDRGLRDGTDFAYILPVPLRPVDVCFEARRLVARAQWLALDDVDLRSALLPLVDTRRHLIAGPGSLGVALDADGLIVFHASIRER